MKCPVCGFENPSPGSVCGCGYDFDKQTGGYRPPFYTRHRPELVLTGILLLLVLCFFAGAVLSMLIVPHIALAIAWIAWVLPTRRLARLLSPNSAIPRLDRRPSFRTALVFVALLAVSLNVAIYWALVIWQNTSPTSPDWWMVRDRIELVCDFLIAFAILAAGFGKGRGRLAIILAAIVGWAVWITMHIGIL